MTKRSEAFARASRLEQFDIRSEAAEACLGFLRGLLTGRTVAAHDLWIEPAAGNGCFLDRLPRPRLGLDIEPRNPRILQGDFLAWHGEPSAHNPIVIGTPPFGSHAATALAFFNHAAMFAGRIAFVLPREFRKKEMQRQLDPRFRLEGEMCMPAESFEMCGIPYAVPTIFQIWAPQLPLDPSGIGVNARSGFGLARTPLQQRAPQVPITPLEPIIAAPPCPAM